MGAAFQPDLPPPAVRLNAPLDEGALPAAAAAGRLRFTTAGSVDDGKSTLIGRLLYDTRSLFDDQLQAVAAASRRRGESLDLALVTDGLRAEREQNITIDVAYRYFSTPRRRFIVADAPGHAQYTRNLVTGASNADLILILLDVRKGLLAQTKRHAFLAALLGIPHFLVAVNKMDLVDYREDAFRAVVGDFREFARKLEIRDLAFVPISALRGDNVAVRSTAMPWYEGATLLHQLETVHLEADANRVDFRFPLQCVLRPDTESKRDYRGLAGRIVSGSIRSGEEVLVLPSHLTTRVRAVTGVDGPAAEAAAGDAVVLTLEDDADAGRGAMIVRRHNLPLVGTRFDAMLCWMGEAPFDPEVNYLLMHTTRTVPARIDRVAYRVNVETLHRQPASGLAQNDIGRVEVATSQPIFFDTFSRNRSTGCFILVDPVSNATVAAGLIRGEPQELDTTQGTGAVWAPWNIPRAEREARNRHRAAVVWFTGLSGSGKSTLARALEQQLYAAGCQTMLLDGDQLRHGICAGLGFSPAGRSENVRRAGEAANLFFESGHLVLCALVSPFRRDRDWVRARIGAEHFLEVFVDCPLEECRRRDPKGLYAAADASTSGEFTGVHQPYEPPLAADWVAASQHRPPAALAEELLALLRQRGCLPPLP